MMEPSPALLCSYEVRGECWGGAARCGVPATILPPLFSPGRLAARGGGAPWLLLLDLSSFLGSVTVLGHSPGVGEWMEGAGDLLSFRNRVVSWFMMSW